LTQKPLAKSEVCVLIPAYNEEKKIGRVIQAVLERGYAVLVVDDGSADATPEVIRSAGVPAILAPINMGKGASLRRGLKRIRDSSYRAAILLDADGQHPIEESERFIAALDAGADLVVGSRMDDTSRMPFVRVATNRFMSAIISWAARQRVNDTQCGYRALSRAAIERIELHSDRFETESEMIFSAADAGLKIISVPISCVYGDEVSHIRPVRDTIRFFKFYFAYLKQRGKLAEKQK
jgi:glycosyltransferase involved in cell wall biosynthesis